MTTKWERREEEANKTPTEVVGAHSYRDDFKKRGRSVLADSDAYDVRRIATWAPFLVLPATVLASKAVPKAHRPRFWIGALVCYAIGSTIMYNTDTSSDGDGPAMITVSTTAGPRS